MVKKGRKERTTGFVEERMPHALHTHESKERIATTNKTEKLRLKGGETRFEIEDSLLDYHRSPLKRGKL